MKRLTMPLIAVLASLGLAGAASAATTQAVIYEQDFSEDATDWSAPVAGDVAHDAVAGTATISGYSFSYFGGTVSDDTYRQTWPEHGYLTEIDVHLDPADMAVGDGFDLTVASSDSAGAHRRDFMFHVGKTASGDVLVNGSNNSDFTVNELKLRNDGTPAEITEAGWYTFQHVFYDLGGSLAVDLNVLDSGGEQIFTTTRNDPTDAISGIGGARYQWFTFATGAFDIDDQRLIHNVLAPNTPSSTRDCMRGGWASYEDDQFTPFKNQGDCVSWVASGGRNAAQG